MWGILVGVVTVAIAIYAMIMVAMSKMSNAKMMIWFAIVVLIPLIGPIAYFSLKRQR
ncbi:MAG: hypothetical protein GY816_04940 [Cytophagales bacterium]|nr:hypothetical protein [Cytophagales bacterium]